MAERSWADVQKRTFTRWANTILLKRMMKIEDLGTDLSDGLLLVNLLEIISAKNIPSYNMNPKARPQKLANISACLQFLKNEGIRLVAIGPEDITDCKLMLILGLIWTIILRYQIQKGNAGSSAKKDLLEWVRKKIPECNVNDFTNSWADGRAVCHLVEALNPGTFYSGVLNDLKGKSPLDNATKGEDLAESVLGIPQILAPEDMVAAADELSPMIYISYFRDYDEKTNASDSNRAPAASQVPLNSTTTTAGYSATDTVDPNKETNDEAMLAAIEQAKKSLSEGGIPIGSVLVSNGRIIGRGHNQRVQKNNPILHAEMDCISAAGRGSSLKDTTIYSTLMPCFMCAGTIVQFKIPRVVVGESRTFAGAKNFLQQHGVQVVDLDLKCCVEMMSKFIAEKSALWNEDIGEP